MPKYAYVQPLKPKRKEKFFDFRDVQTKPVSWASRTPNYLFESSSIEIYQAEIRKDKRERLKTAR